MPQTTAKSNVFFDHLVHYTNSKDSCEALLSAIEFVLHDRGIKQPILPEDVVGRHEFLGGNWCIVNLPLKRRYRRRNKSGSEDEDDNEALIDDDMKDRYVRQWMKTIEKTFTDAHAIYSKKQVRGLFLYLVENGEMKQEAFLSMSGEVMNGFVLTRKRKPTIN